jgi:hypothetical protein
LAGKAALGPRLLERCPEPLEEGFFRIGYQHLPRDYESWKRPVARSTGLREVAEFAFGVNASFAIDARTPTEWGEQRTFFRATAYNTDPNFTVDYAFVSLPGMTAGLTDSLFYFLGNGPALSVLRSPNLSSTQLRYSLSLPAGMTMGFSLESAAQTRPSSVPPLGEGLLPALRTVQAGTRLPDAVASLSTEGDWDRRGSRQSPIRSGRSLPWPAARWLRRPRGRRDQHPQGRKASPKTDRQGRQRMRPRRGARGNTDGYVGSAGRWQAATAYLGFDRHDGRSGGVGTVDTIVGRPASSFPSGLSTMGYYAHVWKPRWTQNLFGSFAVLDVVRPVPAAQLIRDVRGGDWARSAYSRSTAGHHFEALWIGSIRGAGPCLASTACRDLRARQRGAVRGPSHTTF